MRQLLRKLQWLTGRRRRESELAEELRFHLEEEAEASGLPHDEARWAARRDLGNVSLVKEDTRAVWGWRLAGEFLQDLRYAARMIAKNKAFTALAALSLALGIGANTAIYSLMDAILMRQLPVTDPQRLAALKWHVTGAKRLRDSVVHDESGNFYHDPQTGITTDIFPYPAFELLRNSSGVFSALFAYHPARKLNVLIQNQAEMAEGEYVSGDYFRGLGIAPAAGRLILHEDDQAGAPAVAVLSYAFARRRFGEAEKAAGQALIINNIPVTAAGVAPDGFIGVDPARAPDFYLPLHTDLLLEPGEEPSESPGNRYLDDHYYWMKMMGRLRPGVSIRQAQAVLAPIFEGWTASTASTDTERKNLPEFLLMSGAGGLDSLRREYSRPAHFLSAISGLILAIACANIANLLLARATSRRREMAVRLSIGAIRTRVIRQLLTESVLLASLGGMLGILFAVWGARLLTLWLASGDHVLLHAELNWRVLSAAAAMTMLTGLLFGMAPSLRATRVDVMPALKSIRTNNRGSRVFTQALVISQVALSLLLLVAAGLFIRTLSNLQSIDMGFRRENLLVFRLNPRLAGHRDPEMISFTRGLQQQFAAIPGVLEATMTNSPLIGDGAWGWPVVPIGKPQPLHAPSGHGSGGSATATHVLAAGSGFFSAVRIPLLAGREFDQRDRIGSPPVAIVNEAWVKVNLEDRNPLGQHVVSYPPGLKPQDMEIVGVAKNARYDDLRGDFPATVYMPFEQNLNVPVAEVTYLLHTAGNPLSGVDAVRRIVQRADSRIPVTNIETQAEQIDREMSREILFARLCTAFGILALAIACVGLYGTMSYLVAQRTREIGIRMALGARGFGVIWMVLAQGVKMSAVGIAIGVPAALISARFLQSLLFGVKASDPVSLAAAAFTLLAAATAATFAPARRASRVDPLAALRHD